MSAAVQPARRLSELLREQLGLTGTKVGCNAGDCGACTVLLDGEAVCACLVPAGRLGGRSVTTVEGLGDDGGLSRLQQSFLDHGAAQCGICTPGMLVAARALLDKIPNPTRPEVEDALGGVLCRCTGYNKIVSAVMSVTKQADGTAVVDPGAAVGSRIQRLDGVKKINGTDLFGGDAAPDGALLVRVIRSPFPRAGFELGDVDGYVAGTPGIVRVLTAADIPGRNCFGVIPECADQPVFAQGEARFRGEAVAAIVGEPGAVTELDLGEFPIRWTERSPLLTPDQALAEDAPQLHDNRPRNNLIAGLVQRGDLPAGLAAGSVSASGDFRTGFVEHAYIEPEAGFARRVGDTIEIQACTQSAYMDRDALAGILGLENAAVRIIPSAVGGGFGSKLDISLQPYVALAAWHLNGAARIVYTRTESMQSTTKRHPSEIRATVAASADGKLTAMDFHGVFNTGAYASWGPTVANRVPVHASGPYYFPAYRARSLAVHTHNPPAGAFRGFGCPQAAIAQESLFDQLADTLGIDRLEFRIRNALENGMPTGTGQVFASGVGFKACLQKLKPHWERALRQVSEFNTGATGGLRRGVGVAGVWYGCGNTSLPNPSTIKVGITRGGRVRLFQGAIDIGQGANTVITQICADALGLDIQEFELVGADTRCTPDAGKTSASRQTFVSGKAALLAGGDLRRKVLGHVDALDGAELRLEGTNLVCRDGGAESLIALADLEPVEDDLVFVGEGHYDPPTRPLDENGQGEPYAAYGFGAQVIEVEVDTTLGTVKVKDIIAAHDVGRAINPTLVEGQVEGGIAQGIGMALMEEYLPGRSENLHDYLIPTFGDVPDIKTIIVEEADPHGPYGAKGLGEHVLIPTAPAILNAIRHATGACITRLPATPERVLNAIGAVKREV